MRTARDTVLLSLALTTASCATALGIDKDYELASTTSGAVGGGFGGSGGTGGASTTTASGGMGGLGGLGGLGGVGGGLLPDGSPCDSPSECQSGNCEAGECCSDNCQ